LLRTALSCFREKKLHLTKYLIMKRLSLALAIALYSLLATAQENKPVKSNTELAFEKPGMLVQKEFILVGSMKGTLMDGLSTYVVKYSDLMSAQKANVLRFDAGSGHSSSRYAVVDADEADNLIKAIKLIQEKVLTATPSGFTEVSFRSRGGFVVGCLYQDKKWKIYINMDRAGDHSLGLSTDDLRELLLNVQDARVKL
jgi:hypothetical protein